MAKTYLRRHSISLGNVILGYKSWLSKGSGKKNAHRISEEYGSESLLLMGIHAGIAGRSLSFRPIHRYDRIEPTNGKTRRIGVEESKQQICDHIVTALLQPLYDAKIGFYQVASIEGKGQRLCRSALRKWVREGGYHVKLDVRQCYPSTGHDVVMDLYRQLVGSEDVLYVIETLLSTYTGGGLEIGSYFSLRTMQLVLSYGYHHIESLHKMRRGRKVALVSHQIWHMDDIVLMSHSKRDLKVAVRSLVRYMRDRFGLELKPWKIAKVSRQEPLDLGGWVVREYRHRNDRYRCTMRASSYLRATRSFRRFERCHSPRIARTCASYWGLLSNGDHDKLISDNGMGATFAHARSVVSREDRIEKRQAWFTPYRQHQSSRYTSSTESRSPTYGFIAT